MAAAGGAHASAPLRADDAAARTVAGTRGAQDEPAAGSLAAASMSSATAAPGYRASAKAWLDRVIELRQQRRTLEADRELALLRAAYPDLKIPVSALP